MVLRVACAWKLGRIRWAFLCFHPDRAYILTGLIGDSIENHENRIREPIRFNLQFPRCPLSMPVRRPMLQNAIPS